MTSHTSESRLRVMSLFVLLAVVAAACTGYFPARKQRTTVDTVERFPEFDDEAPESTLETVDGAASPLPGSSSKQRARSPGKVIAKTKSGIVVRRTGGGLPKADIWPDDQDRIGLTNDKIVLCMHAPFLLGPVFDNAPEEETVYWDQLNDAGGIFGRKVEMNFFDDGYTAGGTTFALDQCRQLNPFLYLGGVGFDQAPAARGWAESNKQPYLYNMAVEAQGLIYSFSPIPSIENNGGFLGQFVGTRLKGKTVGVIYVDTDNWRAGVDEFEKELKKRGMTIAAKYPIANNNEPDFLTIINDMRLKGINLVNGYINALALTRFIRDADDQAFHPTIVSPDGFDLIPDTVGGKQAPIADIMRNFPGIYAAWVSPAYEIGPPAEKARPSVGWYPEMQRMKKAYQKYNPEKNVNDVDWMFWLYFQVIHDMLVACTKDCSRNVLAGLMLTGYKKDYAMGCSVDFSLGNGRLGGHQHNIYQSKPAGSRSYWRQIETCRRGF